VLGRITPLAAIGPKRHQYTREFLFPEAQRVAGHTNLLTYLTDGKDRVHVKRKRTASGHARARGHGEVEAK